MLPFLLAIACYIIGSTAKTLVFPFDGVNTAGITGRVQVDYLDDTQSTMLGRGTIAPTRPATVDVDLDFSKADLTTVMSGPKVCTKSPKTFLWHIHTEWPDSTRSGGQYSQCSLQQVSNHFDPTFACGPDSEHATDLRCAARIKSYDCTPKSYLSRPYNCEQGDLSGKLGRMELGESMVYREKLTDPFFPAPSAVKKAWNIVLHALCDDGTNTRVACGSVSMKL